MARATDEMKGFDNRLRLVTQSAQQFAQIRQEIIGIARASGTAVADVGQLFARIVQPIRDLGGSERDAVQVTDLVGKSLRITGASATESSAAILQFAQAMGSGVLRGDELNSILENSPRLARAVADGLGVTVGELRKLGEQGQLTSQQVLKALQSQAGALTSEAAQLPITLSQSWTNLGESVKQTISQFDQASGASATLASGINALSNNLPAVAEGVARLSGAGLAVAAVRASQAIQAQAVATREKALADREAATIELQRVQSAVAVATALHAQAAADVQAADAALFYADSSNAAALADQRRAAQARLNAANSQLRALTPELSAAQNAAKAAESVTLLSGAFAVARTAGSGLVQFLGGPWGIAFAVAAFYLDDLIKWVDKLAGKFHDARSEIAGDLDRLTGDFKTSAGKIGDQEQLAKIDALKAKLTEAKNALDDPKFRNSDAGTELAKTIDGATGALEKFDQTARAIAANRTKERGLLGLDQLRQEVAGLVDADFQNKLRAFSTLWRDAMNGARGDNAKLLASTQELHTALAALLAEAKTPAEFGAVIDRAGSALQGNPNSQVLKSTLESAIEARRQAEAKQLDALVAGLTTRMQREAQLVDGVIGQAVARFNSAAALAKAVAELHGDTAGASDVAARTAQATAQAEQAQAALQLRNLEQVSSRRIALIDEERRAQVAAAADERQATEVVLNAKVGELESEKRVQEQLAKLRQDQAGRARSSGDFPAARDLEQQAQAATDAAKKAEDERVKAVQDAEAKIIKARAAEADAAISYSQKVVAEERRATGERLNLLQDLYTKVQQKQTDALNAFKSYASQVINLDKQIASNRLDTAAKIAEIDRQDASPADQAASIKEQLQSVKEEAKKALREGNKEFALELLGQAKNLASQLASIKQPEQSGSLLVLSGGDNKSTAKNEIQDIGAQEQEILKKQRAEAQQAAQQQLQTYQEMTQALTSLGAQIDKLQSQSSIKLKPELDGDAMNATITAIQTALAASKFTIKVTPDLSGLPSGDGTTTVPGKALGGPISGPGPIGRDSVLMYGAPGEHVLTADEVLRAGGHAAIYRLRALLRSGRLREMVPGYAAGGAVLPAFQRPSLLQRLQLPTLPSAPAARSANPLQPMHLTIPGLGTFPVQARPDVAREMSRVLAVESLKRGKH